MTAILGGNSIYSNYMRVGTQAVSQSAAADIADIHYFFNNDATDDSGNGYDANTTSMTYATSPTPAEGTHCGNFTSTSTYFTIPSSYVFSSPFSISCWVYNNATSGFPMIMAPYDDAPWPYEHWRWWFRADNGRIEFRGYQDSTANLDLAYTATSTWVNNTSAWHHMVMTYNNGTVALYYDGSAATMDDSTTWNTSNMKLDLNGNMNIGRLWGGYIDDFSVYSQVLSSAQVSTLYNSGTAGTILTA